MKMLNLPKIVWIYGYEFHATEWEKHENMYTFKGDCTDNPVNDSIRKTSHNGATFPLYFNELSKIRNNEVSIEKGRK